MRGSGPWTNMRRFGFAGLILLVSLAAAFANDDEEAKDAKPLARLKYRNIGPAAGGRVCRVAGVPGDPLTYYLAAAAGGVWKSSDGGIHWRPLFDQQPVSSAGSIAVAPSDPNVIYVGSGEANIRGNVEPGNGIYKSTDAGKTWRHVWKQEGQIGTMIVHPSNPDVAYAAVLGHAFGPNGERGVYRTTDGGKTWQRVLYKNPDTGASDVCFDPSNPRILFAGLWQTRRRPWELTSGGPGSGLYVSRDGGDSWMQLTGKGLPEGVWGKVGVAVAPSDGRRVYALIEADKGGLFRSDDGGESWKLMSDSRAIRQRAWYYTTLTIDPVNPDVIWCPQVAMLRSIDGGKTFQSVRGFHHGDHHDLWIDPKNPRRMIDANDGGVDLSVNGGESWYAPPLPIAQFYHINVDSRTPYHVSGTMQDIGCAAGPSNSLNVNGISLSDWYVVGGGETGFTAHDPTDPNIVYAGEYAGTITRFDLRHRQARNVSVYPENPSGHGAEAMKYRFRWPAPIALSPHDAKTLYHAGNILFRSTDGGQTWTAISPDLTRNDKSKQKWSGGPITGDNTTAEFYCTISAIAESPKEKGLLWAGSDDGLVQVSHDAGKTWSNVTANIDGLPEWGTVSCIEASPHDAATAYVTIDAHKLDDLRPFLFKTTDFGKTWKRLTDQLPQDVYLHVVREDPRKKGLVYLGTSRGVMLSRDGGQSWEPLQLNLPTVAVHDMVVKDDDLVLGTNGRSIWILDDLTAVRDFSPQVLDSDVYLFPPSAATRWRYSYSFATLASAPNPPAGATLYYYLKRKPKEVKLEFLDPQGAVIQTLSSKPPEPEDRTEGDYESQRPERPRLEAGEGVHRVAWDLRYAPPQKIKGAKLDSGSLSSGPMVNPGTYTVRLTADGKVVTSQLVVKPDPRVQVAAAELEEQLKLALAMREDLTRLTRIVNQLRAIRSQLAARNEALRDHAKAEELVKKSRVLMDQLEELESKLHNPRAKVAYDILAQKGGAKLYSRLAFLFESHMDGDGAPTQGTREVYAAQSRELDDLEKEFKRLMAEQLESINEMARKLELPHIIVPPSERKVSGEP